MTAPVVGPHPFASTFSQPRDTWETYPMPKASQRQYELGGESGFAAAPFSMKDIGLRGIPAIASRLAWIPLLWALQGSLLFLDVAVGPDLSLLGYLVIPPLFAATFAPSRQVAALSAGAIASGVLTGWYFGSLQSTVFLVRLGAMGAITLLAVILAVERNRQSTRAEEEHARVRATLDSLLDPHILMRAVRDAAGNITDFLIADANDSACQYNRLPRERFVGRRLLDLLPSHVATGLLELYRRAIEGGRPLVLDDYLYPHDILEEPRYYDIRGVKVGDALSFTWRDVTERHRAAAALEQRVRTDELTTLLNRRGMFEKLEDLRGQTSRTGRDLAVLFVDFDKFKDVNDTYGHAAGDEVLRSTADRIRACLRHSDDIGARVGGDEMMVVLHGVHGIKDAVGVAEKLRRSAAAPVRYDGVSIVATVSVGVTLARPNESTDALVARADAAMYKAKQRGRNQVITINGQV